MKVSPSLPTFAAAPRPGRTDPVQRSLEDRFESLSSRSVRLEEGATWVAGVGSILTFGSMALGFQPVLAALGPIGTPALSTVCMLGFAVGAQRMRKREAEKASLERALANRQAELQRQRDEVERLARPGSAAVDETPRQVTVGAVRLEKRR